MARWCCTLLDDRMLRSCCATDGWRLMAIRLSRDHMNGERVQCGASSAINSIIWPPSVHHRNQCAVDVPAPDILIENAPATASSAPYVVGFTRLSIRVVDCTKRRVRSSSHIDHEEVFPYSAGDKLLRKELAYIHK